MRTACGMLLRCIRYQTLAGCEGLEDRIRQGLGESRTIVIDPAQAVAVTAALSDLPSVHAVAESVRAPFEWTMLDFGPGIVLHERTGHTILGALLGPIVTGEDDNQAVVVGAKKGQPFPFFLPAKAFRREAFAPEDHSAELAELRATPISGNGEFDAKVREAIDSFERLVAEQQRLRDTQDSLNQHLDEIEKDKPTLHGLAAPFAVLTMLESANVDLVESDTQYPRGHVAYGLPRLEVRIRQSKRSIPRESAKHRDFSHRFEVRGNFAHHFETTAEGTANRLFEKWALLRPEKVVQVDGKPCIRIWRPPYVKGPEDKPLIIKTRYIPKSNPHYDASRPAATETAGNTKET